MTMNQIMIELDDLEKNLDRFNKLELVCDTLLSKYGRFAIEYITEHGGLDESGKLYIVKEKRVSHGWLSVHLKNMERFGFVRSEYESPLFFQVNKQFADEFNNVLRLFSLNESVCGVVDSVTVKIVREFLSGMRGNTYPILQKFIDKQCYLETKNNLTLSELTDMELSRMNVRSVLTSLARVGVLEKGRDKNLVTYQLNAKKLSALINMIHVLNELNYEHPIQYRNRPDFETIYVTDENGKKIRRVKLNKIKRRPKK